MDTLLSMGKQAYQQYSESQSQGHDQDGNPTGGSHLNRPAGGQMIDTDGDGIPDFQQAASHATQQSGSSGDSGLFDNAMSFLKSRSHKDNDDDDEMDEHKVVEAHDRAYKQGAGGSLDAKSMGAAAALQAFKQFTSGNNASNPSANTGGGGSSQTKLIGMAMAQAAKLFDSSGGAAGGQKQDAVNSAGTMIMKLMLKQKMGQMTGGGSGNSGGMGGLASLAGKFM